MRYVKERKEEGECRLGVVIDAKLEAHWMQYLVRWQNGDEPQWCDQHDLIDLEYKLKRASEEAADARADLDRIRADGLA